MKLRTLSLGVLIGLFFTACDADNQICTDVGCGESLLIGIAAPGDGELPEGEYEVELELDGQTWTTTCSTDASQTCTALAGPQNVYGLRFEVSGNRKIVGELAEARGEALPTTYSLRVSVDGEVLGESTGTFTYEATQPNGPECEPTCESAEPLSLELNT